MFNDVSPNPAGDGIVAYDHRMLGEGGWLASLETPGRWEVRSRARGEPDVAAGGRGRGDGATRNEQEDGRGGKYRTTDHIRKGKVSGGNMP